MKRTRPRLPLRLIIQHKIIAELHPWLHNHRLYPFPGRVKLLAQESCACYLDRVTDIFNSSNLQAVFMGLRSAGNGHLVPIT